MREEGTERIKRGFASMLRRSPVAALYMAQSCSWVTANMLHARHVPSYPLPP